MYFAESIQIRVQRVDFVQELAGKIQAVIEYSIIFRKYAKNLAVTKTREGSFKNDCAM